MAKPLDVLHFHPKSIQHSIFHTKPTYKHITITSLPYCAVKRILQFLDADSLENLSATCIYFDNLLASKFLISIDFPFPVSFIEELFSSESVDKKPLLKLRCKKSRDEFNILGDMSEPLSMHKLIVQNNYHYMLYSQMSLLDLSLLKEVDLVPVEDNMSMLVPSDVVAYNSFDCLLLKQISRYIYVCQQLSNKTK